MIKSLNFYFLPFLIVLSLRKEGITILQFAVFCHLFFLDIVLFHDKSLTFFQLSLFMSCFGRSIWKNLCFVVIINLFVYFRLKNSYKMQYQSYINLWIQLCQRIGVKSFWIRIGQDQYRWSLFFYCLETCWRKVWINFFCFNLWCLCHCQLQLFSKNFNY